MSHYVNILWSKNFKRVLFITLAKYLGHENIAGLFLSTPLYIAFIRCCVILSTCLFLERFLPMFVLLQKWQSSERSKCRLTAGEVAELFMNYDTAMMKKTARAVYQMKVTVKAWFLCFLFSVSDWFN